MWYVYLPDAPYVFKDIEELKAFAYFALVVEELRRYVPLKPTLGDYVFDLLTRYSVEDVVNTLNYLDCALALCKARKREADIKKEKNPVLKLLAEESWKVKHPCDVCTTDEVLAIYEEFREVWGYVPHIELLSITIEAVCRYDYLFAEFEKVEDPRKTPNCDYWWKDEFKRVVRGSWLLAATAREELDRLFFVMEPTLQPTPATCKYSKNRDRVRAVGDTVYFYTREWLTAAFVFAVFDGQIELAPRWECGGGYVVRLEGESARRFAVGMKNLYSYKWQTFIDRMMGKRICLVGRDPERCEEERIFTGVEEDFRLLRRKGDPEYLTLERMAEAVREIEHLTEPKPEYVVSEHILQYLHARALKFVAENGAYVYTPTYTTYLLSILETGRPEPSPNRWVIFMGKPP